MIRRLMGLKRKLANKYRVYNARKIADSKINRLTAEMPDIDPDYAKEVDEFWSKYGEKVNPKWFNFYYQKNGTRDVRYIPDEIFYQKISYKYDSVEFMAGLEDKFYHDLIFHDFNRPKTYFKNIDGVFVDANYNPISKEQALSLIEDCDAVVIKPTVESGEGRNVALIRNEQKEDFFCKVNSHMNEIGCNFLAQDVLKQHKALSNVHSSSVNTIRILSFLYKGEVYILSAVLRMGVNGSFIDNQCAGGYTCGVNLDGSLKEKMYDGNGCIVDKHPQGFVSKGYVIPYFDKIVECIKKGHIRLAHFGFIGWDFTIDEDGNAVYIEHNLGSPGIDLMQWCNGPLFGDLTEEVLKDVYGM